MQGCNSAYIGQTKRLLGVRLKEHQKAVFTGDSEKSALAEHVLKTGYEIDWSNDMFLDQRLLGRGTYKTKKVALTESRDHCHLCTRLRWAHISCNVTFHFYLSVVVHS